MPFNPYPKAQQVKRKRLSPKRRERGRIKQDTYQEVWERDGGMCARCGCRTSLEAHHAIYRSQGGSGEEWNVALACGPVTQKGTCHWAAHNIPEARKWFEDYLRRLYPEKWLSQDGDLCKGE